MNINKAKEVVAAFESCIDKGTVGDTSLRKASLLPCSKAKIKYAYFVLIEHIIKEDGHLSNEVREDIVLKYMALNMFIEDDMAEKYANNYAEWQSKKSDLSRRPKDEKFIKQYIAYTHMLQNGDIFDEINDYIEELLGKK